MMDGSLRGTMDEEIDRWEPQTEGHTEADVSCLLRDRVRVMERWGLKDIDRDIDVIPQMCVRDCRRTGIFILKIYIIFGVDIVD